MDKNIIKNHLNARFLKEESTPGIDVTKKAQKQSEKINKAGVKDMDKELAGYEKAIVKTEKAGKMATNKFNYNGDKEKEYHEQMEIMNGQEMIQYDRDPNKEYKDRAEEAIAGSSRMGNNPEWANVVAKGQGGDPEFGKNLVKAIKASTKKKQDAEYRVISFGNDIETVPKGSKPLGKHSSLAEGKLEKANKNIEDDKPYGTEDEYEFNNSDDAKKPTVTEKVEDASDDATSKKPKNTAPTIKKPSGSDSSVKSPTSTDVRSPTRTATSTDAYTSGNITVTGGAGAGANTTVSIGKPGSEQKAMDKTKSKTGATYKDNKNNNKPKIKEGMKRLNFKKEFNGVGNALKMIPESYKVDNKVFEMADGNESYKIRWEGTLSEGKAIILTAANKTMVNEDMQKMKHLMSYKSEKTLGTVKGNARLNENAIFNDIYAKTKALLEGEDIEDQDASEVKDASKSVSVAKEAKKYIEGSVSTDKGTQAPSAKTGDLDDAVSQASEAKKHVEGSVETKVGIGLGVKAKEGNWDEINVPQAAEAKKYVTMGENTKKNVKTGIQLGENYFEEMEMPTEGMYQEDMCEDDMYKEGMPMEGMYEEGMYDENLVNNLKKKISELESKLENRY